MVNARHVKAVPGRKTDVADAQWLATLARAGLLRASFIAKADLRSLRHIARQRQKLGGMLASEKNRLHKLLTDTGIRLGVVVSAWAWWSLTCMGSRRAPWSRRSLRAKACPRS